MGVSVSDVTALREAIFSGGVDLPEMEPLLELYRDLFHLVTEPLLPAEGIRLPSGEEARMRMEEGFCLLDLPSLMPSPDALARRASEILGVFERHAEAPDAANALLRTKDVLSALAAGYLGSGEDELRALADGVEGLNPEVAVFTVFCALKGVFLAAARSAGAVDTESWMRGGCPVCGGAAASAYLVGEGGAKHLVCHRCHFRWRVARIFCPSCGNADHLSLGYFTIEGREAGPRVDHCQRCSRYVKTWDIREREHLLPEAEDLKTPSVDLAAGREGYFRAGPNIFGIVAGWKAEGTPFPQAGGKDRRDEGKSRE